MKVAEANVDLARARLAKTRVVAPFAGMVAAREVSPGAFLRAGDPITELVQIREIRVTFSAPERYVRKLTRGSRVSVSTTAYPGYSLTGVIDVVDPMLDPATRSVRVIARVSNPEGRFRPGMSADVSAVLEERPRALTVPGEAVFAEGDQFLVYVVNADSTVVKTPLTLGTRLADVVEVLEGLELGMHVVRAGHQKLFPGGKVNPVMSRPAPETEEPGAGTEETPEISS
jgi:membrane fusion protein (multidrug efflux system)